MLGQEEEEKTVRIKKVIKLKDGTETIVDTTFTFKDCDELEKYGCSNW